MQTQDSQEIIKRFFLALDTLKDAKVIHGLKNFTDKYNINRRNFYQMKKDPSRCIFQVAWLWYLVNDYGINARWLLSGHGTFFKQDKS